MTILSWIIISGVFFLIVNIFMLLYLNFVQIYFFHINLIVERIIGRMVIKNRNAVIVQRHLGLFGEAVRCSAAKSETPPP